MEKREQLYVIEVTYPNGHTFLHSGGRGNGAIGGVYTEKQLKRITGRYPEGTAKVIPISVGFTQEEAELHEGCYDTFGETYHDVLRERSE